MDEGTARKLVNLLGLGVRGRLVVIGVEQVREAAKRGNIALAFVAPDASRHSHDKVIPLLTARNVPMVDGLDAATLGAAVGRETTAAVGVVDRQLARGMKALVGPGASKRTGRAPNGPTRRTV